MAVHAERAAVTSEPKRERLAFDVLDRVALERELVERIDETERMRELARSMADACDTAELLQILVRSAAEQCMAAASAVTRVQDGKAEIVAAEGEARGFRGASFEGLSLLELVRDTGLHQLLREVLATGESQKLRFKLSAAYGRTFEVQATPLAMPTGRGAIAILHDTTDLERLEVILMRTYNHQVRTDRELVARRVFRRLHPCAKVPVRDADTIDVRRADVFGTHTAEVGIAHVIDENEDDVGAGSLGSQRGGRARG